MDPEDSHGGDRTDAVGRSAQGLLDRVAQQALDQDYAEKAIRRSTPTGPVGSPSPQGGKRSWAVGVAFFTFALLVATASMQRYQQADEIAKSRKQLITQVKSAKSSLDTNLDTIQALSQENEALQSALLADDSDAQELLRATENLKAAAGYAAVRGPGVKVVIDNAPHATEDGEKVLDRDLQRTANGLFEAGAEAISINGQRLASLTSIRTAGHTIGVNYRPLQRPYVFSAIGDPRKLSVRFSQTEGGLYMQAVKKRYGLRFDLSAADDLAMPAAPMPKLLFARAPKTKPSGGNSR